jgi:hypothetical protein
MTRPAERPFRVTIEPLKAMVGTPDAYRAAIAGPHATVHSIYATRAEALAFALQVYRGAARGARRRRAAEKVKPATSNSLARISARF